MKRFALVLALFSLAGAASAGAETIVFNQITGTSFTDTGYTVGFDPTLGTSGASVSVDSSFTLGSSATINEIVAGVWVPHGSTLASVQGGIFAQPFAQGNAFLNGSVNPATSTLISSGGTWDIYEETFVISNITLAPGTYYLAFLNAITQNGNTNGNQVLWDISNTNLFTSDRWTTLPSQQSGLDATTFELLGPDSGAVPEPSSLLLLGSGAAALFGAMRRRVKA